MRNPPPDRGQSSREFDSWEELQGWLVQWTRDAVDERVHGTTGERPRERFESQEAEAPRPLRGRPPFVQVRELRRVVHNGLSIEVDTNRYSVPWRLIGNEVLVRIRDSHVDVLYAGDRVARHAEVRGRRQRVVDDAYFEGVTRARVVPAAQAFDETPKQGLTRGLEVYETLVREVAS